MRTIAQIDKDIAASKRRLRRLEEINVYSTASWQDAWDKHPDLRMETDALWAERGLAQQARDEAAAKMARRRAGRPLKAKKCPTCGGMSYSA